MSNDFLNTTGFRRTIARLGRRIDGLASVDPDELARLLLEDEEFRRQVMGAIAALEHQKATNSQFGIAKGQENNAPSTWHLVSADEGLLSINRTGLEAFVASLIKDAIPPGGGNGGNCHCPPPVVKPLDWQTFCGLLKADVKRDTHMFAPFSFPKGMPPKIEFFDKLTFIPINASEQCSRRDCGKDCGNGCNNSNCGNDHCGGGECDCTGTCTCTPTPVYWACFHAEVSPSELITLNGVRDFLAGTVIRTPGDGGTPVPASHFTTPAVGWWGFCEFLAPPPDIFHIVPRLAPTGVGLSRFTIQYDGTHIKICLWDNHPSAHFANQKVTVPAIFRAANVTIGINNKPLIEITPTHTPTQPNDLT